MSALPVLARLRSHGHPSIRATHDSTWELAVDTDITARATCVLGVATELVDGSLDALAGPITLELAVDGHPLSVDAIANPERSGLEGGLVVRRSQARLTDTLATGAPGGAADLDRSWVQRLSDPSAVLETTIRRRDGRPDGRPQLVIGRVTDVRDRRLAAETMAAEAMVTEGGQRAASVDAAVADAAKVLESGGRALLVSSSELVGRAVPELLDPIDRPVVVETFGLSPSLAVAAGLGGTAPVQLVGRVASRAQIEPLLAAVGGGRRVVAAVPSARFGVVVGALPASSTIAVLTDPVGPAAQLHRFSGADAAERAGSLELRGEVLVGLAADPSGSDASVPADRLVAALVDAGVPPSTITRALAQLPGWSRNRAYRAVTAPKGSQPARTPRSGVVS